MERMGQPTHAAESAHILDLLFLWVAGHLRHMTPVPHFYKAQELAMRECLVLRRALLFWVNVVWRGVQAVLTADLQ
ncbi:hypothetical protein IRJ41_001384 [Triplophysa rosa]|uniref:Uncharacterized protein n=1 Tax=Triplophysa rosa TaxID=992332 RepID=A0A9W7X574_TRIRA|nr:hypothetical protein IRJ41_001384 [Triplophysa rosa]